MPASDHLERGRDAYAQSSWLVAEEALAAADRDAPLDAMDLESFAVAAYMLGHEDDYHARLERAHHAHLRAGAQLPAARCAFWIGITLMRRGEIGPAGGWLARADRLVAAHTGDCVERAYLRIPEMFQREAAGDLDGAAQTAGEIAEASQRFGERDLFALATHAQGGFLIAAGRVEPGLRLLDEAMVAVMTGEVSPIPSGIVYCGVILGCQEAHEVRRASQWTTALSAWCERQPDMVAFTGLCRLHRAEVMQLRGAWLDALEEAGRAAERASLGGNPGAAAEAAYRRAELHRLRGELTQAERLYRDAAHRGREPQPGLALLRLVQGDAEAAAATLRRVLAETTDWSRRAQLLPAAVEVMLATDDVEAARAASTELDELAEVHGVELLAAAGAQAQGAVALADGEPVAALGALRRAAGGWRALEVPYESARTRALVARACAALGDEESAALELAAAHVALHELGASAATAGIEPLPAQRRAGAHGLTARELEVLRLVAAGATNKAIAAELVLSERTVDRHVSNILAKLRVPSRSAATAYAYENELV